MYIKSGSSYSKQVCLCIVIPHYNVSQSMNAHRASRVAAKKFINFRFITAGLEVEHWGNLSRLWLVSIRWKVLLLTARRRRFNDGLFIGAEIFAWLRLVDMLLRVLRLEKSKKNNLQQDLKRDRYFRNTGCKSSFKVEPFESFLKSFNYFKKLGKFLGYFLNNC